MKTDFEPLTKRELEVLKLVIYGFSNPEIANELNISYSTAKAHCKSIFEKLNAKNRVEAATIAIKNGIVWI